MRTVVYFDGFNFYRSFAKEVGRRWLDLGAVAQATFPENEIVLVRYFTAIVFNTSDDGAKAQRQKLYLDALRARGVRIHHGKFEKQTREVELLDGSRQRAKVMKEKGSDVNLASWLLLDGLKGEYEAAIVVSNDSDLATPIRMVKNDLGLPVVVACPVEHIKHASRDLKKAAKKLAVIPRHDLDSFAMPNPIYDEAGNALSRPEGWL